MKLDLANHDAYYDAIELFKKRRLDVDQHELFKNEATDHDYMVFIKELLADSARKDVMIQREDDIDSNGYDPRYKLFLSHVRPHGKAYLLEFKDENGLQKRIEYEKDDRTYDECDTMMMRNMKNVMIGEVAGKVNYLRDVRREDTMEIPEPLNRVLKNGRRGTKIDNNVKRVRRRSSSLRKNDLVNQKFSSGNKSASRNQLKCDMNGGLSKEQLTKSQEIARAVIKREDNTVIDEDYQSFLNTIRSKNDIVTFPLPNGDIIEYEKDFGTRTFDAGNSTSCELESWKSMHSGDHEARVEEEEDSSCQCLGSPGHDMDSEFRKNVMRILREPYDHEEYKRLSHQVKIRKNIQRHVELRHGRERSCPTNRMGRSYLDNHKDLGQKIKAVRGDKYKSLNILRGFFFWLENLTREGVFKPWRDGECLEVSPGSP